MGIRAKTLSILVLVLASYIVLTQIVFRLVILPSYAELEREEGIKDINRCKDALKREIHYLDTVVHDWAAWDDTYAFVQGKNAAYRQSNLLPQTFLDNRINAIFFFDLDNALIWGEVRSLKSGNRITLPELSATVLKNDPLLFEARDSEGGVSGIMQTSAGPLLLSCRPVTTSDHNGPVNGHMLMGRFLDEVYIQRLRNQTHIYHAYLPADQVAPAESGQIPGEASTVDVGFEVQNAHTLNGYTVIEDIYGNPALVLKTTLYRHIYTKGAETLRLTLVSVALAGLVILIIVVVLMNRTVIHPLLKLTERVIAIKESDPAPPPLFTTRKDEIGILCRAFNSLIDQLRAVNDGLTQANTQLRSEVQERKLSERRLLANQEKLRRLSSQLTLTEERERRRLAADLHDRISQSLALTQIKLSLLIQPSQASAPPPTLVEIRSDIESIIHDTRTLTFEISPSILYELGVEAAIDWITESMMPKYGIRVSVRGDGQEDRLTDSLRVLVFRSVRELLLNIVKHARARLVEIRLKQRSSSFEVTIQDDGIGFDPSGVWSNDLNNEGFGLFSIDERFSAIEGTVDIHSEPGRGTRVTLSVPLGD